MYCAHRLFLSVAGSFFPHPGNVLEGGDRVFQPFQTMLASAQILEMGLWLLGANLLRSPVHWLLFSKYIACSSTPNHIKGGAID
jgi:hypothetical protein